MQFSHLFKVLDSQKGIPMDLKTTNQKFRRGGGVNNFEIQMVWRVEYFGISENRGGVFMLPMVGSRYFLESPNINKHSC